MLVVFEAGFSQSRVLDAERELFAFYDSLENELGEHGWLVGDRRRSSSTGSTAAQAPRARK